jgi:hypothetical protein
MAKRAQTARTAHTKQKAKPRLISKAHLLERDEDQSALKAAQKVSERAERLKTRKARG